MRNLWPLIEPLLLRVERPARYINHEWGSTTNLPAAGFLAAGPDGAEVSCAAGPDGMQSKTAAGPDGAEAVCLDSPRFGGKSTGLSASLRNSHPAPAAATRGECAHCAAEPFMFCMMYPDTYEVGQANQAVRILMNAVNAMSGLQAERGFLPAADLIALMRERNIPLFSLESCAPVADFDAVGITLPHELCATNILEMLDLAGIPLHADERGEGDPFVIAGGPCAYNPEPYAPFFDVFNIGEGEEMLPELLLALRACRANGASRRETLQAIARIEGVYVPQLYDRTTDAPIVKRVFKDFARSSAWEPCIVPYTEAVHDRLNVEILRGCARGCRFCQAGMMYRPVRERSADNIVQSVACGLASTGYEEVSLTSLSSTDHSSIAEILARLNTVYAGRGVRISLPSQRLDSFGVEMAHLVAGQKKGGLTFAPEAGTQRLRDVINKNVTEDDLMGAVDAAFAAGWRRVKLYFMIGLPTETDEDIEGIAHLAQRVYDRAREVCPPQQRSAIKVGVSVAIFVPKPHTPFQYCAQITAEEAQRRVDIIKRSVRSRAVDISWHNTATSFIEAVLSRGGREAAAWVEAAWRRGARFDAWSEFFAPQAWRDAAQDIGWDPHTVAYAQLEPGTPLPWDHISTGVSQAFFAREYERALSGETTPDCTFDHCVACGACSALDACNDLAGKRGKSDG